MQAATLGALDVSELISETQHHFAPNMRSVLLRVAANFTNHRSCSGECLQIIYRHNSSASVPSVPKPSRQGIKDGWH
jgi:hypothetical protein